MNAVRIQANSRTLRIVTQYREAMRLKTIPGTFLNLAPEIIPFLLGPIFLGLSGPALILSDILPRLAIFFLLFLSWYAAKQTAFSLIEARALSEKESRPKREGLRLVGLVISAIATLAFLQLMRLHLSYETFVGILALVGLGGLRVSLLKKGLSNLADLISLLYLTGIGFASVILTAGLLFWQPLLLALGVACMTLAFEKLQRIESAPNTASLPRLSKTDARSLAFLLVGAPTFVAFLSYMNELPRSFGAVYLTLLLSSRVITALKNAQESGHLSGGLSQRVAGISLLFIAIIAVASHLSI
ncbi:MAG: hypothetical protein J0M12_08875 [Deltaproteobacteria bacterium]|nr:hypothetical protein [Deltaproteobacteria bacterium]